MKITVICVGKIKEKFYREALAEYSKRLSAYCRLQILEVADEKTPAEAGKAETDQILKREGERILKMIRREDYVCALAIQGDKMDSVAFSDFLENSGIHGISSLVFLIGGSLGLHQSVYQRCQKRISFSDLTFPHPLMRVILLEQLYRGFKIIAGEPYHK